MLQVVAEFFVLIAYKVVKNWHQPITDGNSWVMKLQKIDAAKEYYQRKVDFLTQQMEKLQSVLREKFEMKEGMILWNYVFISMI